MEAKDYIRYHEADNCSSILHFLEKELSAPSPVIRNALLQDLCWRASKTDGLSRAIILAHAFHTLLPPDLRGTFPRQRLRLDELNAIPRQKKGHKDVAIVTVIGPELKAMLVVLGRLPGEPPDEKSGDYSYWFVDLDRIHGTRLHVVLTVVAEPRNVPAALAVAHLSNDFNLGLAVLVGIAGGVKGKVTLGDVVCASRVYDYEHERLEVVRLLWFLRRFKRRPRPKDWNLPKKILVELQQFDEERMAGIWKGLMERIGAGQLPSECRERVPTFHTGTVAAGEKLIADGSLRRMYWAVDQTIRAGAMEDSGFAQAAEANRIPWSIFRGISDYGDGNKTDKWHSAASLAASAAAINFLRGIS